jgi:hypothetical protein
LQIIQKGTQQKIHFNVFNDGILTQADSTPKVNIYDADSSSTPITGFSNLNAIDEDSIGDYSIFLNSSLTSVNRMLEVKWSYSVGGIAYEQIDFYSVETAYSSVSEIIDFLGLGVRSSDPNYHQVEELQSAEKIARSIIDGYTGQKFSRRYGFQECMGVGSDALQLVEKGLSIDKVWENDQLLIDNTVDPVYNNFGFNLEITPTGFAIRIINAGWDVRYDNQVDPTVLYYGRFRDNTRYRIQGDIGYKYVPEDIKLASMLLVSDIISNDYNWRNKYLQKVDLAEISFEMAKGAFNGTGNITVDNILDQYRHQNIVII